MVIIELTNSNSLRKFVVVFLFTSHPVKLLKFTHEYLISANIPTDMPELDDDGIAHLR